MSVFRSILFVLAAAGALSLAAQVKDPDGSPVDRLRAAARKGDPDAQNKLGYEYFYGVGRRLDYTVAAYWYRQAAKQGNPAALLNLAICYDRGFGVKKSPYLAFQNYRQAADKGAELAKYNLALIYLNGIPAETYNDEKFPPIMPDRERAIELLEELIKSNSSHGKYGRAALYLNKPLPERKPEETARAFKLLTEASGAGNTSAMRMLADCYYGGWGCEKDDKKMLFWLERAVAGQDREAMAKLGFCYETGEGVEPNPEKAYKYFLEAAQRKQSMAQVKMADYCASGMYTPVDLEKSVEWLEGALAENPENHFALFKLGVYAAEGIGIEKNEQLAVRMFHQAAGFGNTHAQFNVAMYFKKGEAVPMDPGGAFYWFKRAAEAGDNRAQYELGLCYMDSFGTPKDDRLAIEWLRKAAANGNADAIRLLGN